MIYKTIFLLCIVIVSQRGYAQSPVVSGTSRVFIEDLRDPYPRFDVYIYAKNSPLSIMDSLLFYSENRPQKIGPSSIETLTDSTLKIFYEVRGEPFIRDGIYGNSFVFSYKSLLGQFDTLRLDHSFKFSFAFKGAFSSPFILPPIVPHNFNQPFNFSFFNYQPNYNQYDTTIYAYRITQNKDNLPINMIKETGNIILPAHFALNNSNSELHVNVISTAPISRYRSSSFIPFFLIHDSSLLGRFYCNPAFKNNAGFVVVSPQEQNFSFAFIDSTADSISYSLHSPLINLGIPISTSINRSNDSFIVRPSFLTTAYLLKHLPLSIAYVITSYKNGLPSMPYYFSYNVSSDLNLGLPSLTKQPTAINIYPNPCTTYFAVNCDFEMSAVSLYNAVGKEVLNYVLDNPTQHTIIPTSNLPRGYYTVIVKQKNCQYPQKISIH